MSDLKAVIRDSAKLAVRARVVGTEDWRSARAGGNPVIFPAPTPTNSDCAVLIEVGAQLPGREFQAQRDETVTTPVMDGEVVELTLKADRGDLQVFLRGRVPAQGEGPNQRARPLTRSDKIRLAKRKVGNTFALTVLLQKRCQELVRGAQKLVEADGKSPIDLALEEVLQGKIWLGDRVTPVSPAPAPEPKEAASKEGSGRFA